MDIAWKGLSPNPRRQISCKVHLLCLQRCSKTEAKRIEQYDALTRSLRLRPERTDMVTKSRGKGNHMNWRFWPYTISCLDMRTMRNMSAAELRSLPTTQPPASAIVRQLKIRAIFCLFSSQWIHSNAQQRENDGTMSVRFLQRSQQVRVEVCPSSKVTRDWVLAETATSVVRAETAERRTRLPGQSHSSTSVPLIIMWKLGTGY